ncbi:MAG: hypothetical protein Q9212_001075 [Teloschistes hypoglaucus]
MNLSLIDPFILAQDYPDALTGKIRSGHATCLRFNRKGDFLASGRSDGTVVVFDIETNGVARKLRGHTRQIQSLSWSRDGRYLLSSSQDWKCILWDLQDGTRLRTVRFEAPVYIAELHPTNHLLFVASLFEDQPMLVDISNSIPCKRQLPSAPRRLRIDGTDINEKQASQDAKQSTCVTVFTVQGDHIITGTNKGWLNIIDVRKCETVYSTRLCSGIIILLRLTASGRDLVSNSSDRIIRTIPIPNLSQPGQDMDNLKIEVEHKFQDVVNRLSWNHVAFSSTGDYVAASTYMNHDIYVWERGHGSLVKILEGPKEELGAVEWHPHRPFVAASGLETGHIYLWSIITPQRWSALAPDFAEVEENVEYVEREDEFDIHPIEEIHKRRLDLEDEAVDVLTADPIKGDSEQDTFSMPILLDIIGSESEEEVVAVGPGTMRRKSPGEGRDWMNGAERQSRPDKPIEREPPPGFSNKYGEVELSQDGFGTKARLANDGRIDISIDQRSPRLSNLLVPALRSQLNLQQQVEEPPTRHAEKLRPIIGGIPDYAASPPLNVVIQVVGSRGDVQPFVALGKVLRAEYGHRIRLATHPTFRSFIEENGLEFFDIGGDPSELMAFMVKNPGLMPGMDSLRSGDVGKRRKGMYEIVQGCWRSCIEIGDGTGVPASDDHLEKLPSSEQSKEWSLDLNRDSSAKPFVADAIIANPPSFAGIHCAEKLGIPLHLMFTMPWSPTQAFPHPLANIQSSNADQSITNFMSYALVEMMTWQGLGDIINRFREKSLGLEPPRDWGSHISIAGFYFLSLASEYTPDPELTAFFEAGPPPVYIGFGSIVVDDPNAMTELIFDAIKQTGQRALVSKGWGGFGANQIGIPNNVFMLGNVPHDWLFQRVSCVVHHGGAGTTAAGIAAGKPTVVVPFFGDQPFWGSMVAKAGAGPWPVPYKQLTASKLASSIMEALQPNALQQAQALGSSIQKESGAKVGAKDFQEKLDIDSLRCSVAPDRAAVWRVKRTNIRLSAFAATVLAHDGLLDFNNLKLYRPREYDTEDGPWDPITGGASAIIGTIGSMMMGVADFPIELLKALRIKPSENQNPETSSHTISQSKISDGTGASSKTASLASSSIEDVHLSHSSSQSSLARRTSTPSAHKAPPNLSQGLDKPTSNVSQAPPIHSRQQPVPSVSDWNHRKSMAQTLGGRRSRSSSRERPSLDPITHRSPSDNQSERFSLDAAVGSGKGLGRIVGAGLKSPLDFTLGLARGFHNAPKLYGDESVRQPDKVTGIQSGLKAAGKEFGYGMYDGVSGMVTQPLHGAKQEGFAGFIKGFAKGIGGLLLKPQAAFFSIPAYTMSGIYKELQKHFGSSVQNYIVAARTAQGYEQIAASTPQQRVEVVTRWQAAQIELRKEKEIVRNSDSQAPSDCVFLRMKKAAHTGFDERRKKASGGKLHKVSNQPSHTASFHKKRPSTAPTPQAPVSATTLAHADTATFEKAIQQAVQATSQGDQQQDEMIERAIRASVMELRAASKTGSDEEHAVQEAIKASVVEATRAGKAESTSDQTSSQYHKEKLRLALQRSVSSRGFYHDVAKNVYDDSGVETDDDENIKIAIERSSAGADQPNTNDLDLQKAMEESRQAHVQHKQDLNRERTEEEIVLEYVKKQSLLEDKHRGSLESRASAVAD